MRGDPLNLSDDGIAIGLLSCCKDFPINEICAMAGITIDDFASSVAYREIFGLGNQQGRLEGQQEGRLEGRQEGRREGIQEGRREGRLEGRQVEAAAMTLRLSQRRCGPLAPELQSHIQALSLVDLEALAEALLEFQSCDDLTAWLTSR